MTASGVRGTAEAFRRTITRPSRTCAAAHTPERRSHIWHPFGCVFVLLAENILTLQTRITLERIRFDGISAFTGAFGGGAFHGCVAFGAMWLAVGEEFAAHGAGKFFHRERKL